MAFYLKRFLFLFFFFIIQNSFAQNSFAFAPEEHLAENEEKRARELFLQVKCPVCSGQVIESSDAQVAYDLRKLIRDKIKAGKSDAEIKNELIAQFGQEIITSPPFNSVSAALWILPLLVILFGFLLVVKSRNSQSPDS